MLRVAYSLGKKRNLLSPGWKAPLRTHVACYSSANISTALPGVPGPLNEPVLGCFNEFMAHGGVAKTLEVNKYFQSTYGNVVGWQLFENPPLVNLFHPDDIGRVFQEEGETPIGGSLALLHFIDYCNRRDVGMMAFKVGKDWQKSRRLFQRHIFKPQFAQLYLENIAGIVTDFVEHLPEYEKNLRPYTQRVAVEMMSSVLFGVRLGALKPNSTMEKYVENAISLNSQMCSLMYADANADNAAAIEKFERAIDEMRAEGEALLAAVMEGTSTLDRVGGPSYLQRLLNEGELSAKEITDNVPFFLFAGVDTTSNTIQGLLTNLAQSPHIQDALCAQLSPVLHGGPLLPEIRKTHRLPLLSAAIKENFRLIPTAPGDARILNKDITIRGSTIPAGVMIGLAPYPFQMSPRIYRNPEEFDPYRWGPDAKAERKQIIRERPDSLEAESARLHDSPYLNIPFGRGPRMCLGARLADAELSAVVAGIVQKYNMSVDSSSPPYELIMDLLVRPTPMPIINFTPRD